MFNQQGVPANWTRATADQIISDRPVVLYGVQVYVAGQTGGQLIIRNGQTDQAPIVRTIAIAATASKSFQIDRGILLDAGLYVDFDAYITEATVNWLPFVQPISPSKKHREVSDHDQ